MTMRAMITVVVSMGTATFFLPTAVIVTRTLITAVVIVFIILIFLLRPVIFNFMVTLAVTITAVSAYRVVHV